ncbi:MAG: RDD family protein [Candidatus Doudnabacteria bacterium]|nr:RDD family protein [Candidatus Doudnabacteria bacterium]
MNTKLFHPLLRLIAIGLNILVSDFILIAIFAISGHTINNQSMDLAVLLTLALWFVILEPLLLAGWGTTPAWWLLRIKMEKAESGKLTYAQALVRSVLVLLFGIGYAAVPFVALMFIYSGHESYVALATPLLMLAFAIGNYFYFINHQSFYWDKWLGIRISHENPGWIRLAIALIIFLWAYGGWFLSIIR